MSPSLAGPLTPPVGPITSTHKTLTEVEPRTPINFTTTPGDADSVFRITASGSYYLPASFFGAAGKHGIEIANSNVTIDLNGFTLNGGTAATLDGISVTITAAVNIRIINGSIINFGGQGIDAALIEGMRIEKVQVRDCGLEGFSVGPAALIRSCVSSGNFDGFSTGEGCILVDCISSGNDDEGIFADDASVIVRGVANSNDGAGIAVSTGSVVDSCSVRLSADSGIFTGDGTVIHACDGVGSTNYGISTGRGSLAIRNRVGTSTAASFNVGGASVARFNTAGLGVIGFRTDGYGARVDQNTTHDCNLGFRAEGSGSLFLRNMSSSDTESFSFVANNIFGPIVTRFGVVSPAITGSAGASTFGTTDLNANIRKE